MDAVDVAILRTMGVTPSLQAPQEPDHLRPARIARVLGMSQEAVRDRLRRLEEAGVVAGYEAYPNLHHLGLKTAAFLFRVPPEEDLQTLGGRLRSVDGLLEAHFLVGSEACVDLAYRTEAELQRRLGLLSHLLGDDAPTRFLGWALPPPTDAPTPLDWRIVAALRHKARRPLPEVADDLGVGYRTVKRHYDGLVRGANLFCLPQIQVGSEGGLIPFWLLLHVAPGAPADTARRAQEAFAAYAAHVEVPPGPEVGNLALLLFANTPAQVETLRRAGASLEGIRKARALVPCGGEDLSAWLDEAIVERAAKATFGVATP